MARARAAELARPLAALVVLVGTAAALVAVWIARPDTSTAAGPDLAPLPADAPIATGPITPARLQVPAIGVDATVESRGTVQYENPFTGQQVAGYGVPESMRTTSWWSDGPQPGSGEMAVVLGHGQAAGGAVFADLADLADLEDGDEVLLVDGSGAVVHLRVLGDPVTGLDEATSALADTLDAHPDGADLALITCGGVFDEDAGAGEDNEVVFATVTTP